MGCCTALNQNTTNKVKPHQHMVYSKSKYPELTENEFNSYKREFLKMNIEKNNPSLQNLTKAQLIKLFEAYKINIPPVSVSGLMQLVDENKNGVLEFNEYINLLIILSKNNEENNLDKIVYTTKAGLEVTKMQFDLYKSSFDYYDRDKDRFLNFNEFLHLLKGTKKQLFVLDLLCLGDVGTESKDDDIDYYREVFDKFTQENDGLMNLDIFLTLQLLQKDKMKITKELLENNANIELNEILG